MTVSPSSTLTPSGPATSRRPRLFRPRCVRPVTISAEVAVAGVYPGRSASVPAGVISSPARYAVPGHLGHVVPGQRPHPGQRLVEALHRVPGEQVERLAGQPGATLVGGQQTVTGQLGHRGDVVLVDLTGADRGEQADEFGEGPASGPSRVATIRAGPVGAGLVPGPDPLRARCPAGPGSSGVPARWRGPRRGPPAGRRCPRPGPPDPRR